jgi:hypothetical protein
VQLLDTMSGTILLLTGSTEISIPHRKIAASFLGENCYFLYSTIYIVLYVVEFSGDHVCCVSVIVVELN